MMRDTPPGHRRRSSSSLSTSQLTPPRRDGASSTQDRAPLLPLSEKDHSLFDTLLPPPSHPRSLRRILATGTVIVFFLGLLWFALVESGVDPDGLEKGEGWVSWKTLGWGGSFKDAASDDYEPFDSANQEFADEEDEYLVATTSLPSNKPWRFSSSSSSSTSSSTPVNKGYARPTAAPVHANTTTAKAAALIESGEVDQFVWHESVTDSSDSEGRTIIVGDLHGSHTALTHLLAHLSFSPLTDTLLHTGDILGASVKDAKLTVQAMKELGARGVRGNHDQGVVKWRAWMEAMGPNAVTAAASARKQKGLAGLDASELRKGKGLGSVSPSDQRKGAKPVKQGGWAKINKGKPVKDTNKTPFAAAAARDGSPAHDHSRAEKKKKAKLVGRGWWPFGSNGDESEQEDEELAALDADLENELDPLDDGFEKPLLSTSATKAKATGKTTDPLALALAEADEGDMDDEDEWDEDAFTTIPASSAARNTRTSSSSSTKTTSTDSRHATATAHEDAIPTRPVRVGSLVSAVPFRPARPSKLNSTSSWSSSSTANDSHKSSTSSDEDDEAGVLQGADWAWLDLSEKKVKELGVDIPAGWEWDGTWFRLARALSTSEAKYVAAQPLTLHLPAWSTYVVHAGMLPWSDPKAAQHHSSSFSGGAEERLGSTDPKRFEPAPSVLRSLASPERSLLLVDQNREPGTLLGMRTVSRESDKKSAPWTVSEGKKGTPWMDVFGRGMDEACAGLGRDCKTPSVVYGHWAAKGLDVRVHTVGLDSGCAYDGRLSALVLPSLMTKSSSSTKSKPATNGWGRFANVKGDVKDQKVTLSVKRSKMEKRQRLVVPAFGAAHVDTAPVLKPTVAEGVVPARVQVAEALPTAVTEDVELEAEQVDELDRQQVKSSRKQAHEYEERFIRFNGKEARVVSLSCAGIV